MNAWILTAVIVQALVSRFDRKDGAALGFLITGGMLILGLGVYAQGSQIVFFGIPLGRSAFVALCTAWFAYDMKVWRAANAADTGSSEGRATGMDVGAGPVSVPAGEGAAPVHGQTHAQAGAVGPGHCPNCRAVIAITSANCPQCKADFGAHAAWQVLPRT